MKWTSNEVAVLGMATTVVVALLSALAAYLAAKRDSRRSLYSEAVQVIVSWKEMLYRVRRRSDDQTRDLINSFHGLQDKLAYYQAWISGESKYMSRSYARLVQGVKGETEALIAKAWQEPGRSTPGEGPDDQHHPDISRLVDAFAMDLRSHLSPLPWRKLAVAYRNRESVTR
jgi:hypothetical protein